MDIVSTAFPVPDEFEAEMGTVNVPLADGLPEIAPLLLFKLSPFGSPEAEKSVGELFAEILYTNGVPATPEAPAELEITGASVVEGLMIDIVSVAVPTFPDDVVMETGTWYVPGTVGVPLITPVEAFTLKPDGRFWAPKVPTEVELKSV